MIVNIENIKRFNGVSGIYKLYIEGKVDYYIGSSVNIYKRLDVHLRDLIKSKHHSKFLQRRFDKYKDRLRFEVIARCPREYTMKLEQWFLDNMNPTYNSSKIAVPGLPGQFSKPQIIEIFKGKADRLSTKELAEKYKVSTRTINTILGRKTYQRFDIPQEYIDALAFYRRRTIPSEVLGQGLWLRENGYAYAGFCRDNGIGKHRISNLHDNYGFDIVPVKPPEDVLNATHRAYTHKPVFIFDFDKVKELRKAGKYCSQIADIIGTNRECVRKYLKANNIFDIDKLNQ